MTSTLLAGDLGGTKTLLALAEPGLAGPRVVFEKRYDSRAWDDFPALFADFLAASGSTPAAACLGVAGPTDGRSAQLTYLPWHLDAAMLERSHGIAHIRLVNDLHAAASGIDLLEPASLRTLQLGRPEADSPRLIIGIGTGLGVAGAVPVRGAMRIIPGEGGHIGFSPQTPQQGDLWRWLLAQRSRVTTEDVLCGAGLARLYAFLGGAARTAAEIGDAACTGRDPRATDAVDLWLSVLGAFAGDLALAWLARGGVYLAGGMASRLLSQVRAAPLVAAFRAKREHRALAEGIPLYAVLEERLGLLGALNLAASFSD